MQGGKPLRTLESGVVCQSCGGEKLTSFYTVTNIPVHSVLQMHTREVAMKYPTGDLSLAFCRSCGFIFNVLFDPSLHEYSARYEETQGYSDTFNAFHRGLAQHLIERYNLRDKDVIEIGSGKGEFLLLLCRLGNNHGIGFDPAYVEGRSQLTAADKVKFVREFYSERYSRLRADFVCCKMTLEHIHTVADFVGMIRRSMHDRYDTVVFFQVPSVTRILSDLAFWDIYYEHCSYFSSGSLARLFRSCGFEVMSLGSTYSDQYLTLEARPAQFSSSTLMPNEEKLEDLCAMVGQFSSLIQSQIELWRRFCRLSRQQGLRTILWGSGSKAVAFLGTIAVQDSIEYVVDINPHRQGTFMAGSGQEIVAPEFLGGYRPDIVIAINPVYQQEIRDRLDGMGLAPVLVGACRADASLLGAIERAQTSHGLAGHSAAI
jgi:Methyltransferase domain/C-methyltransferase C-terminal domain